MSESEKKRWLYTLVGGASSTKRGRRTATPPGQAYDCVGGDGAVDGGMQVHPGFKWIHDLTGVAGTNAGLEYIVGFFPVTFRVSSSESCWGAVYVVWNDETGDMKVFVEFRRGVSLSWEGPTLVKLATGVANGNELAVDVVVVGRYVFTFIEGQEPCLFYHNGTTLRVETDTGPGAQPLFDANSGIIVTVNPDPPPSSDPPGIFTTTEVLYQVTVPTEGEPANARLFLVVFTGGSFPGVVTMPGPSVMTLWTVTPEGMEDPVWGQIGPAVGLVWQSGLGPLAGQSLAVDRPPSSYTFAYQLYDTRTGRKSQLSELAFQSVGARDTNAGYAFNQQREYIVFGMIELVYDTDKYDQAYVYRSVRALSGARSVTLNLDAVVELETFQTTNQSGMTGSFKRVAYFYQLIDPILAGSPTFQGDIIYDVDMPTAGAALLYDSCVIFGNTTAFDQTRDGLGVLRWSNPYEVSPEQVSPFNRYNLTRPDEEILRFLRVGPNVIGYSATGVYHIRKENFYLKVTPIHEMYGGPSPRGACVVGSNAYVATESGLKAVGPMGEIVGVEALDKLFTEDWRGQVGQVELAKDGPGECVFVLNPAEEHAAVLWLRTSVMTELYDCNFKHVTEGEVPFDPETSNQGLQTRAVFVQKIVDTEGDVKWRMFVYDYARQKDQRMMLDPEEGSNVRFTLAGNFNSGTTIAGSGFGERLEGCKLYVLSGEKAGASATIKNRPNSSTLELEADASNLYGITAGTRLGISPVYYRWTGYAAGLVSQQIEAPQVEPFDYFRLRNVETVGCVFSDVGGNAFTVKAGMDNRFAAGVFKGNEEGFVGSPIRNFPVEGNGGKKESVVEGPSVIPCMVREAAGVSGAALFPFVEVICPELDFTLLGVVAVGTIRDSDREAFPTVGPPA